MVKDSVNNGAEVGTYESVLQRVKQYWESLCSTDPLLDIFSSSYSLVVTESLTPTCLAPYLRRTLSLDKLQNWRKAEMKLIHASIF